MTDRLARGLAAMARERWAAAFDLELKRWQRESGLELMGTESLESDVLARIAGRVLCEPPVLTDAASYLADYANAGKEPPMPR